VIAATALALLASAQAVPTTIPEMWNEWCARCHALDGSGKVNEPTVTVEPLNFTECKTATAEPDADWELAIAKGGPAVGLSSQMPAFGDTLNPEQVHAFVEHIRGFCNERGWPHGNMNFPRPIFTEKAFPENEFLLLPFITHRKPETPSAESRTDLDFVALYERRLGRRAMWEAALPLSSHDTGGTPRRGIGDIELALKYVLGADVARTRIASAGVEVALPTGSEVRGLGSGTVVFEPYLAAGTMWRNVYFQAQTKIEFPVDTSKAGRAFVYNLYGGRDTSLEPTTWTIGLEINGENEELALTPQVRKGLTRTGALGAAFGVRLPINERHEQGTALVGYLLWEYLEPVRARP
jgi:Cytochrome C oxidase, cbb3-type, subunit III